MIVANYDICMIGIVLTIISLAVSGCYVLAQRVKPFGTCSDLVLYRTDYQLITPPRLSAENSVKSYWTCIQRDKPLYYSSGLPMVIVSIFTTFMFYS